ncbi:hypothetical protein SLEP1_g16480 [Rubroshorea leprosula]|uniref:Uncharacterized protein n=1 Tax=Rubroshorea leprosula TaxID=152421 RepID=A0AAV5IR28_9ROSI|nr:hypothetical protein SLEP1_g16480 [Rubroshorea leprosula]
MEDDKKKKRNKKKKNKQVGKTGEDVDQNNVNRRQNGETTKTEMAEDLDAPQLNGTTQDEKLEGDVEEVQNGKESDIQKEVIHLIL